MLSGVCFWCVCGVYILEEHYDYEIYGQCPLGIDDQRDCLAQRGLFLILFMYSTKVRYTSIPSTDYRS